MIIVLQRGRCHYKMASTWVARGREVRLHFRDADLPVAVGVDGLEVALADRDAEDCRRQLDLRRMVHDAALLSRKID